MIELSTFQGRLEDPDHNSANGCTVIAPLVVSRNLRNVNGVLDFDVEVIIDNESPPLLHYIRTKLKLGYTDYLHPMKVHEELTKQNILSDSGFLGCCGGSILNKKNIDNVLRLLEGGKFGEAKQKRTRAAFYFDKHLVSFVKVPVGFDKFCYYMVESLPQFLKSASYLRCDNLDAVVALIHAYAFKKVVQSDHNQLGIQFEEATAKTHRGVFQSYVWAEDDSGSSGGGSNVMDSIETSDRGTSNQEETEMAITCDETNTNMWTPPSKKHSAKTTKQNQDSFRKTDCSVPTQNVFAVLEIEVCVEEQKASAPFAIHQPMETNNEPSPL